MPITILNDRMMHESRAYKRLKFLDIHFHMVTGTSGETSFVSAQHGMSVQETPGSITRTIGASYKTEPSWDKWALYFLPKNIPILVQPHSAFNSTSFSIPDHWFVTALRGDIDLGSIQFAYFELHGDELLIHYVSMLARLARTHISDQSPMLAETLLTYIVAMLLHRFAGERARRSISRTDGLSAARLQDVSDYIEANLHRVIRLSEMAGVAGLSPFHFSRAFRQATNTTPLKRVMERRIAAAKIALHGDESLVDIAITLGFSSQSHFTTAFGDSSGRTPQQFRDDD